MAATRKRAATSAEGGAGLIARAALVSFKDDSGRVRYLYAGTAVPDSMPQSEIDRLSADGLIGPESEHLVPGVGVAPQPPIFDDDADAVESDKD